MRVSSGRRAHFIAPGERALILRALRFLMHEQQAMITEAYHKYKAKRPEVFEDHKRSSMNQINAAEALRERFRNGDIFNPDPEQPQSPTESKP